MLEKITQKRKLSTEKKKVRHKEYVLGYMEETTNMNDLYIVGRPLKDDDSNVTKLSETFSTQFPSHLKLLIETPDTQ